MADGRRNNGGHSTKGKAGRKPKSDEIKMIELMDATKAPAEVWEVLAAKVEEGDVNATKAWLSYRYGRPKETKDIKLTGEQPLFPE